MRLSPTLSWTELGHSVARQYLDARSTYTAWVEATTTLKDFSLLGGEKVVGKPMQLKAHDTSVSSGSRNSAWLAQHRLACERLRLLTSALERHRRVNQSLSVGQAPIMVTKLLRELQLASRFGIELTSAHAVLGYAAAAGVRLCSPQDASLAAIWTTTPVVVRKFELRPDVKFIDVLTATDGTFVYDAAQGSATNADGLRLVIDSSASERGTSTEKCPKRACIVSTGGDMAEFTVPEPTELVLSLRKAADDAAPGSHERYLFAALASAVDVLATTYLSAWPKYALNDLQD